MSSPQQQRSYTLPPPPPSPTVIRERFHSYDGNPMDLELDHLRCTYVYGSNIEPIMSRRDVIFKSRSGTRRIMIYSNVLEKLDPDTEGCQALVVTSTDKLAQRIQRIFFVYDMKIKCQAFLDGRNALHSGFQVAVGTPARVQDMIEREVLRLDTLKFLVLDGADEMLSVSSIEQIYSIFERLPRYTRTILLSATISESFLNVIIHKFRIRPLIVELVLMLPNELLLEVFKYLESERDMSSFVQVNHAFRSFKPELYRYNSKHSGSSALLWAAEHGEEATARYALKYGADVRTISPLCSASPLMLAAKKGHVEVAELLLDNSADLNSKGGCSKALEIAAENGRVEVVKLLLDRAANLNSEDGCSKPLELAAQGGHVEVVKLLLDRGAILNPEGGYSIALGLAAEKGHAEAVKLLLDRGAILNPEGGYSRALGLAAEKGHAEAVKLLLDCGVDPNIEDGYSKARRLVMRSFHSGEARGANPESVGNIWSPLMPAARNGHLEVIKVLERPRPPATKVRSRIETLEASPYAS